MNLKEMSELLDVIPMPALVSEMVGEENSSNVPRFINTSFVEQIGYSLDDIPTIECWFNTAYPMPSIGRWQGMSGFERLI